jgi:glycosyltransferase involved in cell wall biosynthesis
VTGLLSPQPRFLVDTYSPALSRAVHETAAQCRPDVVVASQIDMLPYALELRGLPVVLEELELGTVRDATQRAASPPRRWRAWLTWLKLGAWLRRTLPRVTACTVVSAAERDLLRAVAPAYRSVYVIPNAVDLASYAPYASAARPGSLVFSGALTYRANYDAVEHLLRDILPLVHRQAPDVTVQITGSHAGVDRAALPSLPGVRFTGYVPDVRPTIAQSWASLVPLRLGGGTRLKIIEAMALGTPVVSTPKGAEGLDVTHGEDILIAAGADDFAAATLALLGSPALRERLAAAGRQLVAREYDWQVVGARLRDVLDRARAGRAERASAVAQGVAQ